MTLKRALDTKLVKVRLRPTQDRYNRAALLLTPLVRNRPWIVIRPQWRVDNPEDSGSSDLVLVGETRVRLHSRANRLVFVPQVQLSPTFKRGGSKGAALARLDPDEDAELLELLAETARRWRGLASKKKKQKKERRRLWGDAQLAVWMLHSDSSLETLRRSSVYGMLRRPGYTLVSYSGVRRLIRSGEDLERACDLLRAGGLAPEDYRACRELESNGGKLPWLGIRRRRR